MEAASSSVERLGIELRVGRRRITWEPGTPTTWNQKSWGFDNRWVMWSLSVLLRPTQTSHPSLVENVLGLIDSRAPGGRVPGRPARGAPAVRRPRRIFRVSPRATD